MINGETNLIGLLGNPVKHSISPAIQNAAIKEMGLNLCYLALCCESKHLENVLKGLSSIDCKGLNVTIPHKEQVAKICDELSPIAKRIGAVNTLIPNEKGGWIGTNTDVTGFLSALEKKTWKGKEALIIGCGGSARAVGAGLQDLGLKKIKTLGRNHDSLEKFIEKINRHKPDEACNIEGLCISNINIVEYIKTADLIINTTPIGMKVNNKKNSEMPLNSEIWKNLEQETILYDLIYTPKITPWLAYGKQHGCQTINGLEMLINQGAASLALWCGSEQIPINTMRKAAYAYLNSSDSIQW